MSKQLALSATFSILMMAVYVLFGIDAARAPIGLDSPALPSPVEITTPDMPDAGNLLSFIR